MTSYCDSMVRTPSTRKRIAPQSPYDVDHFRPKSEARRSEKVIDEGYPWLAFDWDNFRYSAALCTAQRKMNRPAKRWERGAGFRLQTEAQSLVGTTAALAMSVRSYSTLRGGLMLRLWTLLRTV